MPEVDHRNDLTVEIRMEKAFVPETAAFRMPWVMVYDMGEALVDAPAQVLLILRHEQDGTLLFVANLVYEFRESGRIRKVQSRIRFATVAVALRR